MQALLNSWAFMNAAACCFRSSAFCSFCSCVRLHGSGILALSSHLAQNTYGSESLIKTVNIMIIMSKSQNQSKSYGISS